MRAETSARQYHCPRRKRGERGRDGRRRGAVGNDGCDDRKQEQTHALYSTPPSPSLPRPRPPRPPRHPRRPSLASTNRTPRSRPRARRLSTRHVRLQPPRPRPCGCPRCGHRLHCRAQRHPHHWHLEFRLEGGPYWSTSRCLLLCVDAGLTLGARILQTLPTSPSTTPRTPVSRMPCEYPPNSCDPG